MLHHWLFASAIIFASLGLGIAGYRITEGLAFIDALLNASMILGGMARGTNCTLLPEKLSLPFTLFFRE